MPSELTREQAHWFWSHRTAFGKVGRKHSRLTFARERGRCGFYFELNGRTYNMILDARAHEVA